MKDDVLQRMNELGCPPPLGRLVERLADDVQIVATPGVGDFLPLAARNDCVAAAREDELAAATERAMRRSAGRSGTEPAEEHRTPTGRRAQRTCPESSLVVPASGACERHGASC